MPNDFSLELIPDPMLQGRHKVAQLHTGIIKKVRMMPEDSRSEFWDLIGVGPGGTAKGRSPD